MVKNKDLVIEAYEWDEEEVSSDDNEIVELKVLMALDDDENHVVCKESVKNGVERPWLSKAEGFILPNHNTRRILPAESQGNTTDPPVAVTDSSATEYDSADESLVCNTPFSPLEQLVGAEPVSGPKTIKSILKSNSSFKAKALKGVIVNEHSSAPVKTKALSLKANLAPTVDIRKPIWYLDSRCSRHMTGVKSYLHKYAEQPGLKVVFGDDSTCTTKGYGFVTCNVDKINIAESKRYPPDEYLYPYEPSQRAMAKELNAASAHECLFIDFLSEEEPKKMSEALNHPGWVDAIQEELNQFAINKVWTLVSTPYVYQMDVKSAFLNGKLKEEVYVKQPLSFKSSEFPNHVCKLDKALYGLKQAPRAWYETLLTFLTEHKFVREKYVKDLLKKYDINGSSVKTPMVPPNKLGPDLNGKSINETQYRGMIRLLMYLTASRPDIQFLTCLCARYQANPKESYLIVIKRIFKTSTSSACQMLGGKLVCWSVKKQQLVAMYYAKAKYVTDAGCCANILWMKSQLIDYDIIYDKVIQLGTSSGMGEWIPQLKLILEDLLLMIPYLNNKEEYIKLEEEKACRCGKVHNWETATYCKIWYDEDVHDLRSIETKFPAIVFNDSLTSEVTLTYEPMISPLNDNKIDFRISFDESDDEDYTVIYDKNSFSYKIISTNNLKTDSKNDNDKVNMHSFPSPEPMVSYFDDLDFLKNFENEFSAIVYNDALTSKSGSSTEPVEIPHRINEFDLKTETTLSKCGEKEQNILYFNDLFPFNIIHPDDLKSEKDNDDDKTDIKQSSMGNVINTDVGLRKKYRLSLKKDMPPQDKHEIVKTNHALAVVHDSEDTLEIAEITRKKVLEKMKIPLWIVEQLQGKNNTIRILKEQISHMNERRGKAYCTLDFKALDSQDIELTELVTTFQEQNERFRAENEKVKHNYKELYDFIKIMRAKTIEKTSSLLTKIKTKG
nr:hypothetical protein [Tanacetum cinerariifolium]